MVTGTDNSFKTARTFPHMTQIMPNINGSVLTIKAPGMEDFTLEINALSDKNNVQARCEYELKNVLYVFYIIVSFIIM